VLKAAWAIVWWSWRATVDKDAHHCFAAAL